jgi:hypothetical protein
MALCTDCSFRSVEINKDVALIVGMHHVTEVHPSDYNAMRWAKQVLGKK